MTNRDITTSITRGALLAASLLMRLLCTGFTMIANFTQIRDQHLIETFGELKVTDINETLEERGNRYGEFGEHARITQGIKRAMSDSPNWNKLTDDKREALEMLAHKIGRILNGDPEYKDSWHDIIGYTKLVEDTLSA